MSRKPAVLPICTKYIPVKPIELFSPGPEEVSEYLDRFNLRYSNDTELLVAESAGSAWILYGPRGVGKTTLARAIAKHLDFHIIELNSSDDRRGWKINNILGESTQSAAVRGSTKFVLFFDDIDIITEEEKGAYSAIMGLLAKTKAPFLMTWEKVPKELKKKKNIEYLYIPPPELADIMLRLQIICFYETLNISRDDLKLLVNYSNGDMGFWLNQLPLLAAGNTLTTGYQYHVDFISSDQNYVKVLLIHENELNQPAPSDLDYLWRNLENLTDPICNHLAMLDTIPQYKSPDIDIYFSHLSRIAARKLVGWEVEIPTKFCQNIDENFL